MDETRSFDVVKTLPHDPPAGGDTTRRTGEVLPLPEGGGLERIGGYRVLRELGRGGMGVVYLAESLALRRQVALKVLTAGGDVEAVERFQLEARAVARLKHPNVVGVHEVGRDGPRWFLAMDLVDGESLRARVQRDGPLAPEDAARLLEPIARALHHAHCAGLLHRDVKPHNVLVARDGTPLLADFGLAKDVGADGVTVTGEVMGTPAYMAPEQACADHARVDRRADVYALGATLYEALAGRPPFVGASAINVLRQVIEDPPVPPSRLRPGLPRDLETICLTCLEKAPGARYDTAGALADDLSRWLRHEPVSVRPPGLAGRALRWARRRPGVAAAAALALLAVLGASSAAVRLDRARRADVARRAAEAARAEADATSAREPLVRLAATQRALEAARRWRAEAPGSGDAEEALVRAALAAGEAARLIPVYWAALQAYEAAAEVRPDPEVTRSVVACRLLSEADGSRLAAQRDLALERCDEALAIRPGWSDAHLLRAQINTDNDPVAAQADYDRALALDPDLAQALYGRASVRQLLGDHAAARRDLDRVIALRPSETSSRLSRASVSIHLGDLDGAREDVERALDLRPGSALALAFRARIRAATGDLPGAVADAEAAVDGAREHRLAWRALATARERLLGPAAALEAWEQAVRLDPDKPEIRRARAEARQAAGDLRGVLEDLDEVLRARRDPVLLKWRGDVRGALGDLAGAYEDFDQAVVAARVVPPLLGRAEVRRQRGDPAGAMIDARAITLLEPESPHAYLICGLSALELGRDAAPDLERFLALAPPTHPGVAAARAALERLRGRR
ncbi:MAG: protein kinase [Planctomycetes bacterium]|nr:protein kinase [Planctomycetota bacterium]